MVQSKMKPDLLALETIELCRDGERRENMIGELKKVRERLGAPGACERAAEVVCGVLEAAAQAPAGTAAQQELVNADG
jgi:lipid A disaccharide synthetase